MCHFSNLTLALGLLFNSPVLVGISGYWLTLAIPFRIIDVIGFGMEGLTSLATHAGGMAIALAALSRIHPPRRIWAYALIWYLFLQAISRFFTPPELNINAAHTVYRGWESFFNNCFYYWWLVNLSAGLALYLLDSIRCPYMRNFERQGAMKYPTWVNSCVTLIILLVGFAPVLIYLWIYNRTPILPVEPALAMLNETGQNAILVDVRSWDEFSAMHIAGSLNWPAAEIASLDSLEQIPADFQRRKLLLICNGGFQSALSGEKLKSLGVSDVYSIRGGLQSWIGISNSSSSYTKIVFSSAGSSIQRPMTLFEQTAAVVSGFGFKPLHMILSAVLGFVLLRQRAADLRLFGWGIVIFLMAEIFCAINYLFYNHNSYLAEYLHS